MKITFNGDTQGINDFVAFWYNNNVYFKYAKKGIIGKYSKTTAPYSFAVFQREVLKVFKSKIYLSISLEEWNAAAQHITTSSITSNELLKIGGKWLGAAREYLKWHVRGGDHCTWGSQDLLTLTVRQIEEIAAESAATALNDYINRGH